MAVSGGYEGQLIQGEINVKIQAQISEGRLQGLLLMKDIDFANNKKNENESYLFCSDGRYGYEYYRSEDISMGSYNDTFTESDEHSGNWHPVASLIGENVLMLEATDGRVLAYSVYQSVNGIMINNKEFKASANGQCN